MRCVKYLALERDGNNNENKTENKAISGNEL